MNGSPTPSFWLYAAIAALAVLRFLTRELRERKLRKATVYAIPIVLAILAGLSSFATLQAAPWESGRLTIAVIAALIVGLPFGLAVVHYSTVRRGESPAVFYAKGSATTVGIWIAALLLRMLGRAIVGTADQGNVFVLNTALVALLASAIFVVRLRFVQKAAVAQGP